MAKSSIDIDMSCAWGTFMHVYILKVIPAQAQLKPHFSIICIYRQVAGSCPPTSYYFEPLSAFLKLY